MKQVLMKVGGKVGGGPGADLAIGLKIGEGALSHCVRKVGGEDKST